MCLAVVVNAWTGRDLAILPGESDVVCSRKDGLPTEWHQHPDLLHRTFGFQCSLQFYLFILCDQAQRLNICVLVNVTWNAEGNECIRVCRQQVTATIVPLLRRSHWRKWLVYYPLSCVIFHQR